MKRKRLLLLLALLITAATGAWGMQIYISYPAWPSGMSVNGDGNLVLEVELSDSFEYLKSKIEDKTEGRLDMQYMHLFYEGTECPNDETLYAKGVAANSVLTLVYDLKAVKLADGIADAGNWTATLGSSTTPQSLPVYTNRGDAVTLSYGGRLKVKSVTATHDGWNGDLSNIPASALDGNTLIVPNGATLKGKLDVSTIPYKVVIPAGATVTLKGVNIEGNSVYDDAHKHAGITCEGNATIILADGSDNTVKGFYNSFPGIQPGPATTTLTITGEEQGTGKLTASSNGWGAGIGAGHQHDITECGNILITGGIITAIGSNDAAAIGSGQGTKCGDITITNGVTKVTAKKEFSATYRIGPGDNGGTCGTVTIGGTVYWENDAAVGDGATYLAQATIEFVNLAKLSGNYEATNGTTLFGRLAGNYKISIADGATVTLDGVTINGVDDAAYKWAGINCDGDATIVLKDGSENMVKGFHIVYPGIYVPEGKTLIIQGGTAGNGKLTASSNGYAAGIGGGQDISCGNIRIEGGDIMATGGDQAAGIGNGMNATCGKITISGGTVTANGGRSSAGIGSGWSASCGDITIASTVKKVTAMKGEEATYSIGRGDYGGCGTITIGGTVYWQDDDAVDNDADTYLMQATITYVP